MAEPSTPATAEDQAVTVDHAEAVERLREARDRILGEVRKVIVGQEDVIDEMMTCIFARGHCLLVGVPGLAKTLLVSSLAKALSLSFKRIQFTPDLMPTDITGSEILQDDPETGRRVFGFQKGPIFANLILADEINRTPPKTQAALLEAMQEKTVSAGGEDFQLEEPFFVLATQNPIEQEGTYPLPEAQLDRFLFNIMVAYPQYDEEIEIVRRVTGATTETIDAVLNREEILALQQTVRHTLVAEHMYHYAVRLIRATRPSEEAAPDFVRDYVAYGAGPRASLNLVLAGKSRAALRGRYHVSVEDLEAVAVPVLRHRVIPNFAAQSEALTAEDLVRKLIETIPSDERLYEQGG